MKLPLKYFSYIGLLHGVLMGLVVLLLRDEPWWFLLAEAGILVSLAFAYQMYKAFVVPVKLIAAGAESLKEKDFSVQFNKVGQGELDALVDVYNRMIEQLRLERTRAAEQHYLLEKLIQASPAGILLLDLDGNIATLNIAAQKILGETQEALKGKPLSALPAPFANELTQLPYSDSRVMQVQGNRFYRCIKSRFIDRGFERQFIILEELTEEILRTEKQAYDKVIRMMSHEVNNSICAINSILQSFADTHKEEEDYLQAIEIAITRNQRLSRFMANFSEVVKIPSPKLAPVSINQLLQQMTILMESESKKRDIRLSVFGAAVPVWVNLDTEQFEQALINILKNAIEAADHGGEVQIRVEKNGLRVLNTGNGIPADVQKMLFTPFYSTKPQGQGIGLMLVREILRNHGFDFALQTRPDGWTEFFIGWDKPLKAVAILAAKAAPAPVANL
jgi:two-component system, NtrC family, nitrogen regulation sensor histidine kinase NtrY